jgi:hypothetical protein
MQHSLYYAFTLFLTLLPTVTLAYNASLHQLPLQNVSSFSEIFTEGQPALTLHARVEWA